MSTRGAARVGLGAAVGLFALSLSAFFLAASSAERSAAPFVYPVRPAASVEVGTAAPDFTLADARGQTYSLQSFRGQPVVLCFTTAGCAVSTDYDARLRDLSARHQAGGRVQFLTIHSRCPDAARRDVQLEAAVAGLRFPQLVEPGADVASRYGVESTPAFVLVDAAGTVRYAGALDDSRNAENAKSRYLSDAIDKVLGKQPVTLARARR